MKLSFRILTLFSACLLFHIECHAQNNAYKIKDNLYSYFLKLNASIQSESAPKMADTLFNMAVREHDVKAQCIALYCKQRHAHYTKDVDTEISVFRQVSPFILKTPYLQYYFGMWNNVITTYINHMQIPEATAQVMAFRKEAFRLNSYYGIFQSYVIHGNIYTHINHFKLAYPYYQRALDYANDAGIIDLNSVYFDMARCDIYLSRWDDSKKYIDLILKSGRDNDFTTTTRAMKLILTCVKVPTDSAEVRDAYREFMLSQSRHPILQRNMGIYNEAMYYYYKLYLKDERMAKTFITEQFSILRQFELMKKANDFDSIGDYRNATQSYFDYIESIQEVNSHDEQYLIDEFVPQLDLYNLEREKTQLRRRNEAMKLHALQNSQRILTMTEQKAEGQLITNHREHGLLMSKLAIQSASIEHQNRLLRITQLKNEQRAKSVKLADQEEHWRMMFSLVTVVTLLALVLLYAWEKRKRRNQLQQEKAQAEKSNYIKSLFFQNMNHEIRTPLNAISGFNDVLNSEMSESMTVDEKNELINMISINSRLLTTLVSDVIDLSDFESGTYKLNFADVNINSVCNTAVESIRGRQKTDVQLSFQPQFADGYVLHTDAQRLQQVLTNYLSNACKHTDSGHIVLSYEVLPDVVRFSVADTGCGVDASEAETVFERFRMVGTKTNGTGLGLHICRLIANLLHGHAYLDTAYKLGARFIFDHPVILCLLAVLLMSFSPLSAAARNKSGFDDRIYARFPHTEEGFMGPDGLQKAKDMYAMATKYHDSRAQSFALFMQTILYNYAGNLPASAAAFQASKKICFDIGFIGYAYDCWMVVITDYLERSYYQQARKELLELHQIAWSRHDSYGMASYYYVAGCFYFEQRQYAAAICYYLQSIDHENVDRSTTYYMIARSYWSIGNFDKVQEYCDKAISSANVDVVIAPALALLEKCYSKLHRYDEAREVFRRMEKMNMKNFSPNQICAYHEGLFNYYAFVDKDEAEARKEEQLAGIMISDYDRARYLFELGTYKEALSSAKIAVAYENRKMAEDYKDINDFYIGKFFFNQSLRDRDMLALKAVQLRIKATRNSHQLLMLKHEHTKWLLRQDEMLKQNRQNRLQLQSIQLASKKAAYQQQQIIEQGLQQQKDSQQSRQRWQTLTMIVLAVFILTCIIIYVRRLHKAERAMLADALKAKEAQQKKDRFYDSFSRIINEPIDTIIRLNQKLNGDTGQYIPASERQSDVRELDDKASFLTDFINSVLMVSKLESGTYQIKKVDYDIPILCQQAIHSMKDSCNIVCHSEQSPGQPFVSDAQLIQLAVGSFLRFASKHAESGSSIHLEASVSQCQLTVGVSYADGQMSAEARSSMFDFGNTSSPQSPQDIRPYQAKLIAQLLQGQVHADDAGQPIIRLVFQIPVENPGYSE